LSNPLTGETDKKHEEATAKSGRAQLHEALPSATLANTSLTVGSKGILSVEVSCPAGTISCTARSH
jgi:hypothetical protein